jgi:hypothetical protein
VRIIKSQKIFDSRQNSPLLKIRGKKFTWICRKKENEQKCEQTMKDGYCRCSFCGAKCDDELPKRCNCVAYIDNDGEAKCKSCHKLWTESDIEMGICNSCIWGSN